MIFQQFGRVVRKPVEFLPNTGRKKLSQAEPGLSRKPGPASGFGTGFQTAHFCCTGFRRHAMAMNKGCLPINRRDRFQRMQKTFFQLYNLAWRLAIPLLRQNPRLNDGYADRAFQRRPEGPVDLWIQAASAGEAYLAESLLKSLPKNRELSILLSTNTRQGMEILESAGQSMPAGASGLRLQLGFFPFDQPSLMQAAVQAIRPRVMVLLETELWPGLLAALRKEERPVLLVNARLTPKSFRRYRLLSGLWKNLAPDRTLAVSRADAKRFARLFDPKTVGIMSNIKFDRMEAPAAASPEGKRPPLLHLSPATRFVVLGSVRKEEEADVDRIIGELFRLMPEVVIGLFPRHLHRLPAWEQRLARKSRMWRLRSRVADTEVPPGTLVLWDRFGALKNAYSRAAAVFVGGSLAPLGGQNFLEPLMHGVVPVIGPSWENFAWVGEAVFDRGLVCRTSDWREAARALRRQAAAPRCREEVKRAAADYIASRTGGAEQASRLIMQTLEAAAR